VRMVLPKIQVIVTAAVPQWRLGRGRFSLRVRCCLLKVGHRVSNLFKTRIAQLLCHSQRSVVQLKSTEHQDSARARPTDLESTVVWASARCGYMQTFSLPPDCGRFFCFGHLVRTLKGARIHEHFLTGPEHF